MTDKNGFTLMELLVTVAIMGIILSISTISYRSMAHKANIEGDTRRILAMTNLARQYSFTRKIDLSVHVENGGKTISIKNGENVYEGFEIKTATGFITEDNLIFSGGFSAGGVIRSTEGSSGAEYDCVLFEANRIKAGKFTGGVCNAK